MQEYGGEIAISEATINGNTSFVVQWHKTSTDTINIRIHPVKLILQKVYLLVYIRKCNILLAQSFRFYIN